MPSRPVLFWDSAALVRAVMGSSGGAARQLLKLGEAAAVDMRLSRDVSRETERVLRRHGDDLVGSFAAILDRARFAITLDPSDETVDWCEELTGYRPDARVLAAAHECAADVLVTTDSTHFIGNPMIGPPDIRCAVRTPVACLEWLRDRLRSEANREGPGPAERS